MRLLVTADLHFNHGRSRQLAIDAIDQINRTEADILLLVGDTACADGEYLEQALSSIQFPGPKLIVAGNHELWTKRDDSYAIFTEELPRRVRDLGWHWLERDPFVIGDVAFVGSIGWYDYSYAPQSLNIPRRFYEAKVSPGAAEHLNAYAHLLGDDVTPEMLEVAARWNDAKFVRLGKSDDAFLDECLAGLTESLSRIPQHCRIISAVHHVPFQELLPPRHTPNWDFARAYLGSDQIGQLLLKDARITHAFCGHSHFAAEHRFGNLKAINIGSGYRQKRVLTLDV